MRRIALAPACSDHDRSPITSGPTRRNTRASCSIAAARDVAKGAVAAAGALAFTDAFVTPLGLRERFSRLRRDSRHKDEDDE